MQRLNREGVEALRKHSYEKAEKFFYQAYLVDPDDPFTLNNLGYVSELQGQVERAASFYALAAKQPTDAVIDLATSKRVQGRSMTEALAIPDGTLKINHDNVEAVRLLSKAFAPQADVLLQKTLKTDPQNVFTLNNLGVAKEMEGESQEALRYYDSAAASRSDAAAVVTINQSWRGKPVVEMAAQNAKKLRSRLEKQQNNEVTLAELNFRGVLAINRNDLKAADQDFRSAYALDPNNAFALNKHWISRRTPKVIRKLPRFSTLRPGKLRERTPKLGWPLDARPKDCLYTKLRRTATPGLRPRSLKSAKPFAANMRRLDYGAGIIR